MHGPGPVAFLRIRSRHPGRRYPEVGPTARTDSLGHGSCSGGRNSPVSLQQVGRNTHEIGLEIGRVRHHTAAHHVRGTGDGHQRGSHQPSGQGLGRRHRGLAGPQRLDDGLLEALILRGDHVAQ